MLGRGISRQLEKHPPAWFLGDVLPILRESDAVIANLECPITTDSEKWKHGWKMFHFRAAPAAVGILQCANVRFVSLANNHILDFGAGGLIDTLKALDTAGVHHAGAGRNADEAAAPVVMSVSGLRVGLIAATDNMRGFAAAFDRPGTNFLEFTSGQRELDWIADAVHTLRALGAELVVLSVHWGPNMRRAPSRRFRRFAHAAIDCGVNILHGHSAHVVQAIECYGSGIVLYDTGNFIDDYWKFPFRNTVQSFVFLLDVEDGKPKRLQLVPVRIHASPLGLATGATFKSITASMKSLCAAMGTVVIDTAAGLEIPFNGSRDRGPDAS
jgi:poly-gamma-glutamate synthesis protein (capsule biosynthesis protein)